MGIELTERQRRIMTMAAHNHSGNLSRAAHEDRLFGMALIHCLSSLCVKKLCSIEKGCYILTSDGYTAVGISAPDRERVPCQTVREGSKLQQVIELLRTPGGATMEQIVTVTGWKQHTVRAAISRTIRKEKGIPVIVTGNTGETRYYQVGGGHDHS